MTNDNNRPKFVAGVISGGMLNIPNKVQAMNEIEEGDLLELEIIRHKKSDESVVDMEEDNE